MANFWHASNAGHDVNILDLRKSLYGGRAESFHLYVDAPEGQSLKGYDSCSLYPTCMMNNDYCVGSHEITEYGQISMDSFEIDKHFGIICCSILPPQNLFVPMIPFRKPDGSLVFCLCRMCALTRPEADCDHSPIERQLYGSYFTREVAFSLKYGYTITSIYEVSFLLLQF